MAGTASACVASSSCVACRRRRRVATWRRRGVAAWRGVAWRRGVVASSSSWRASRGVAWRRGVGCAWRRRRVVASASRGVASAWRRWMA
ncbi:hypothetical protein ACXZ9C_11530 [Streptococcus agalactiae]